MDDPSSVGTSLWARARAAYRRLYMGATSPDTAATVSGPGIRATYAVWSKFYDAGLLIDPAFKRNARALVEATVREGDHVLDVGTGTGLLLDYAAPRARSVVGVDYSPAMLAKAAARVATRQYDHVALRWADARHLPLPDGSCDAVVSSFMLAHIPRPDRGVVLREFFRVTRPGGRLGMYQARGELFPIWPTRLEINGLLREAGYTQCSVRDTDDIYRLVTAERG